MSPIIYYLDIGAGASAYDQYEYIDGTLIDITNPANDTGFITSIQIYISSYASATNVLVGTFYGSAGSFTNRDFANLGTLTPGSHTINGLHIAVSAGDFLGVHADVQDIGPYIDENSSGGSGVYYDNSGQNRFNPGTYTYTLSGAGYKIALYGTGSIPPPPGAFALSSPSNGAINQAVSGALSWGASSDAATYDVFLDQNNPPTTKVSADQAGVSYGYSGLQNGKTYYWEVVAKNTSGNTNCNANFNFATLATLLLSVNGSWKSASPQVSIGGIWKAVTAMKIKVAGVWKNLT
jgi:hypothetical protein